MKNNIPNLRNFVGGILFGLLIVAMMTMTVGCSAKKDTNGSGTFGWGGFYAGGPSLGQYIGNSAFGAQLALQFNSTNGTYGNVWANGQLMVRSGGISCIGGGAIAPGVYTVDSTNQQPGIMSGDFINNLSVVAYGPYGQVLKIEVPVLNMVVAGEPGYLNGTGYTCNGIGGFNEMYGTMKVYLNGSYSPCFTSAFDYLPGSSAGVCL